MALEVPQTRKHFNNNHDLAFQFKLARELGMTVATLRATMSLMEYNQWIGFLSWEQKQKDEIVAMQQAELRKRT